MGRKNHGHCSHALEEDAPNVLGGGVTSYVDLYQDHPSMIFRLFMTAGHLSHSMYSSSRPRFFDRRGKKCCLL